jgi:DNA-binding beta-propeller fold protein YncE
MDTNKLKSLCLGVILLFSLIPVVLHADETYYDYFKKGIYRFNNREYEASIEYFRKALGEKPDDTRAHYFLALAYFKAGFEENAIFELNTLIQGSGEDEVLNNLISYLHKKQFLLQNMNVTDEYTLGMEIKGNPIGKYILSRVTGLDVDASSNIYVCGFGSKIALKISSEGKPLFAFTSPKVLQGRVYDIVVNGDVAYISDYTKDTVYKYTTDGRYLGSIGSSGLDEGKFFGPTSIAVDSSNNLYVIDSGNMRVEKFSEEGQFLMSFGKEGDLDGEFRHPSGIALDRTGRIYIADRDKKQIFVFDKSGNYLTALKKTELVDPYGIFYADDNRLIISDGPRIISYDITHSSWKEILSGGRLKRTTDVRIDKAGQLYACDFDSDTIMQFIPKAEKYRNANVLLTRVDSSSFPTIVYYVTVLSADGFPLYGLGPNHFLLKIGGDVVEKIDTSYTDVRDSKLEILFLVDKSLGMQSYEKDVERYMRSFVNSISSQDEMAVIGFNENSRILTPFTPSKLKVMDAILDPCYADGKAFDRAFRRGIDYLNKRFYKKAVVVVTDGNIDDNSFLTYSFNSCMNYAANNNIPVFILSFGGRENQKLDYFSRTTGGKFYDVLHSNEFIYIYDTVQSYRSPEYIIYFSDVYDPKLKDLFVEAEVDVDFNGRIGKSRLGFIYP